MNTGHTWRSIQLQALTHFGSEPGLHGASKHVILSNIREGVGVDVAIAGARETQMETV